MTATGLLSLLAFAGAVAVMGTSELHRARSGSTQPAIVQNPAPDTASPAYRISAEPVILVGGLNDDERYEILAFSDATILASGNLAVAIGSRMPRATQIRIYGPRGRFVRSFGREGQGPGEFSRIARLIPLGDSLLVHDAGLGRRTLFDSVGTVVRTIPDAGSDRCCFSDGSYLIVTGAGPNLDAIDAGDPAIRDSMVLRIGRPGSTAALERILTLPSFTRPICVTPRVRPANRCPASIIPPFSPTPVVAIAGDEIVYGDGSTYEYLVYSPRGQLLRTVRAAVTPRRPTADEVSRAQDGWIGTGRDRELRVAAWGKYRIPATAPVYHALLTEDDGTVWIGSRAPSGSENRWARFDRSGKLIGTVRTPGGARVVRFLGPYAILARYDRETQTQTIAVHRIERIAR